LIRNSGALPGPRFGRQLAARFAGSVRSFTFGNVNGVSLTSR
jgi:hypothetical protein